jgi:hypothetical protein
MFHPFMGHGFGQYPPVRPPPTCFNYSKLSHFASNCTEQPRIGQNLQNRQNMYANAFEMFDANMYDYYGASPWYMDSGASGHVAGDIQQLDHFQANSSFQGVQTARGEKHGTGTTTVKTTSREIKLENVMYVPSFKKNLLL